MRTMFIVLKAACFFIITYFAIQSMITAYSAHMIYLFASIVCIYIGIIIMFIQDIRETRAINDKKRETNVI